MNKGLQIRNSKRKKNLKKCNEIKPEQEGLCRFVIIKYQIIERINGKYRRTGSKTDKGLQIQNRIYLLNGKYKLVNSKSLRITKELNSIPEWATKELIDKYNEFLSSK